MEDERPTHLDLFSGIGGFALAAKWAGFETIGFCEIEAYPQRILAKNFGCVLSDAECHGLNGGEKRGKAPIRDASSGMPEPKRLHCSSAFIYADIRTLDGKQFAGVDLITGGFPCQPFSCAGKRRGKEDDRHLWPEMLRVITEARPAWVLGENVAGIIGMELDTLLSDLETIGYACRPFVIPACGVDARHRRNRVWIVAHRNEQGSQVRNGAIMRERAGEWIAGQSDSSICDSPEQRFQDRRSAPVGVARELQPQFERPDSSGRCRWEPEPGVGRVAHGIPSRVDRLRGLGNAIVPQVAYQILKAIRQQIEFHGTH